MEHQATVTLVGLMADDPKITETKTNKSVCNFSVITKIGKSLTYHRCVAWEKMCTPLVTIRKGDPVRCVGMLRSESYVDAKTNEKKYVTKIICDEIMPATDDQTKHRDVNDELMF